MTAFYGTQPPVGELPETLPAGTKWKNTLYHGSFTTESRLRDGCYLGAVEYSETGYSVQNSTPDGYVDIEWIDWSSVPRQPTAEKFAVGDWVWTESSGIRYVGRVNRVTDRMVYADDVSGDKFREWCALLRDAKPWQPQPGEWCEGPSPYRDDSDIYRGRYEERPFGQHVVVYPEMRNGCTYATVDHKKLRPIPPPNAPGSAEPFRENCADCGKPIENPLEACKRTQVLADGSRRLVKGAFHADCDAAASSLPMPLDFGMKTPSPERERPVDPYVEHRATGLYGDAYITDNRNKERRDERIAALASSDHPLDRAAARLAKRRQHIDAHREAFGRTWRDPMTGERVGFYGRVK